MRRTWNHWLGKLFAPRPRARSRRLEVCLLEAREVPALLLPSGLLVSSGLYTANGDVVAGQFNGTPAYVNIDNGTAGAVTVLPSLSVTSNGASGNPAGSVQDVIRNAVGETILVGSSQSDTSRPNGDGEASTWLSSTSLPVGYGFTNPLDANSILNSGATQGDYVGTSNGNATLFSSVGVTTLPVIYGDAIAGSISSNSNYIVGVDGGNSVAWKKNASGNYELVTLQAPTAGGPLGFMSGVVNNFAAGQYYDPILEAEVGAIWNLDTGAMVRDFKSYGAIDPEVQFQQIGNEFVAIFSGTEGQSPLVHLFNANRSFELSALGLTGIARVTDIWQRPNGALGLSYLGTNGNWYFESITKNDLNQRWDGFAEDGPAAQLPNGFTAYSGLFTASGDVVAGTSSGTPAYLSINGAIAGSVTVLPSLSVATNGASGNPAGFVFDVIRDSAGELLFVGSSQSDTSSPLGTGESSTWILGSNQPSGYGFISFPNSNSSFLSNGNSIGDYVGSSDSVPVIHAHEADSYIWLPSSNIGSLALGISADSNYIVGVDADKSVAWKRNAAGIYDRVTLEAPTAGGPLGFMSGVVNNYAAGQYYDPITEGYEGAIWDLDTGLMVRDFGNYGYVDALVDFQQIGDEFVAVFSRTGPGQPFQPGDPDYIPDPPSNEAGYSPFVHLFKANRTFLLTQLPSLGAVGSIPGDNTIGRVSDIWERPDGSLGLSYLGIDGNWYYDSLPTNDRNEPWTTAPAPPANQPPVNLQLSGSSIAENLPAGTSIGTLTATDPEGAALTFSMVSTGVPFEVVNGVLRSTAALDFETTPSYTLTLRATDPQGESVQRDFVVNVTDENETPPPPSASRWLAASNGASKFSVIDSTTGAELYSLQPFAVAGTGLAFDFNGDNVPDLLAAAGPGGGPHVRLIDGASGQDLFSFFAYSPDFRGGIRVATADVDGDGISDIITGAGLGGGPHVKVFGGRDGAELASFLAFAPTDRGGVSVAAGDLDHDGAADVIVGAGAGSQPTVKVFSGRTFEETGVFRAYAPVFLGGVNVAVGDVNGDGELDIITGAGLGGSPHVQTFNGQNFQSILSYFAFAPETTSGVAVGTVEANGDDRAEIVTVVGGDVRIWDTRDLSHPLN